MLKCGEECRSGTSSFLNFRAAGNVLRLKCKKADHPLPAQTQQELRVFCGCRPLCKRFWIRSACDRVRSSVRPMDAAFTEAAGRYGDLRTRSKSVRSFCPYGLPSHTSLSGFRPILRPSQFKRDIAPIISSLRISLCPALETRPSQAAKSRPQRKLSIGGAKASIARAVCGPTPGIVCSRRDFTSR